MSHDKDDRYMVTIQVPGRGLGLGSLSTVGAEVLVGVWPDQQQAGLDTQQRRLRIKLDGVGPVDNRPSTD